MDNKKLGNEFEKVVTRALDRMGAWAHFIQPNKGGQQPFDIIAIFNYGSFAIDCKTCVSKTFNINRLEDNQITAFNKFLKAGGDTAYIIVWHENYAYIIPFWAIVEKKSVKLDKSIQPPLFEKYLNQAIQEIFIEDEKKYGRKSILQ